MTEPTLYLPSTLCAPISSDHWRSKCESLEQGRPVVLYILVLICGCLYALFLYHFPASVGKAAKISNVDQRLSNAAYEKIVNDFLQQISFRPAPSIESPGLKNRVIHRMTAQGVSQNTIQKVNQKRCIETAATMTAYTYPFASASVQEAIASFAAYAISIDDLTSDFASDLQAYTTNLTLGCPQRHSLLQGFTTHLSEQPRVFGAYGGDMIIKGALEFISSALVEFRDMDTLKLPAEAGDFLIPFRAKTGVAEPFAFFCFPEDTHPEQDSLGKYLAIVPTIMLFLDYVNDILSFYKENMRMKLASGSDSASFIKSYARLHGISLREALQRTTVEAVDVVKRLRAVCKQDPAVFGHIEPFIQGYISFHLSFPRYKLSELDIPLAHRGGITL